MQVYISRKLFMKEFTKPRFLKPKNLYTRQQILIFGKKRQFLNCEFKETC